jgi:hypothetical protein
MLQNATKSEARKSKTIFFVDGMFKMLVTMLLDRKLKRLV